MVVVVAVLFTTTTHFLPKQQIISSCLFMKAAASCWASTWTQIGEINEELRTRIKHDLTGVYYVKARHYVLCML